MTNLKDLKPFLIQESCNVMAMFKFNIPTKDGKFTMEDLGDYEEVNYEKIKKEISEEVMLEDELLDMMDIGFNTGRTKFSGYFVDKAQKICDILGQDWEFTIYENVKGNNPVFLVNQQGTAFIIAPRVNPPEEVKND